MAGVKEGTRNAGQMIRQQGREAHGGSCHFASLFFFFLFLFFFFFSYGVPFWSHSTKCARGEGMDKEGGHVLVDDWYKARLSLFCSPFSFRRLIRHRVDL